MQAFWNWVGRHNNEGSEPRIIFTDIKDHKLNSLSVLSVRKIRGLKSVFLTQNPHLLDAGLAICRNLNYIFKSSTTSVSTS